jgi:hypothetical protein
MIERNVLLGCKCGKVRAAAERLSGRTVNRIICYCGDCQAYARHLDRAELLGPRGGSDIVQLPAGHLRITAGHEHIAGLKLTTKSTIRWYARCCRSPIANLSSAQAPALGVLAASFLVSPSQLDDRLGAPIGHIHGQDAAPGGPPLGQGIGFRVLFSAGRKVLLWAVSGKGKPNPFIDRHTSRTFYPVTARSGPLGPE